MQPIQFIKAKVIKVSADTGDGKSKFPFKATITTQTRIDGDLHVLTLSVKSMVKLEAGKEYWLEYQRYSIDNSVYDRVFAAEGLTK